MPLDRPPLALGQGTRGVQEARRWVGGVCAEIGRPELVECAQLGVSELVTNALLHGEPPVSVRVRGTAEHPRIEVRDSSVDVPILPGDPLDRPETDDLLLTFGRGLTIVARCAEAWGAEVEDGGKVVWLTPASDVDEGDGAPGTISGVRVRPVRDAPSRDRVRVEIRDVPLTLYADFQAHFRELRREVRLLALAHEEEYPLAKDLADLFGALERQLRDGLGAEQVQAARAQHRGVTDLVVHMPRGRASTLARFVELLRLADGFCREQRMLSLARSRAQVLFQEWFLLEFVRQAHHTAPLSWFDVHAHGHADATA